MIDGVYHWRAYSLTSDPEPALRDLRSGDVTEPHGQDVRICINSAEGDVELEL